MIDSLSYQLLKICFDDLICDFALYNVLHLYCIAWKIQFHGSSKLRVEETQDLLWSTNLLPFCYLCIAVFKILINNL